jgi:hypothetical protein
MEAERQIECYEAESILFNKTYGKWTADWWRWALSTPASINPLVDKTGQHAAVNQPSDNIWFLAGRFGSLDRNLPSRKAVVPERRSILFPILNCAASPLEYPQLKSDSDLIEHVERDISTIVKKDCFINGRRLNSVRVPSDPKIFPVTINKENTIGVEGGGSTRAAADGYWVFLKPITPGYYTLSFEGSCEFGRLNSGARYELQVM